MVHTGAFPNMYQMTPIYKSEGGFIFQKGLCTTCCQRGIDIISQEQKRH